MYIVLMIVHIFVCLVLIAVILLQAGRGGGVSDVFGGAQAQSILGTQTNTFMTRATEVCAVVFVITSLSLGFMSTQKGKSLVQKEMQMQALKQSLPGMPSAVKTEAKEAVTAESLKAASTEPAAVKTEEAPAVSETKVEETPAPESTTKSAT